MRKEFKMHEINWKVRIKNKVFWIALIPAVLILIQTGCRVFGVELDFGDLQDNLIALKAGHEYLRRVAE